MQFCWQTISQEFLFSKKNLSLPFLKIILTFVTVRVRDVQ